jgi:hypothetical protein
MTSEKRGPRAVVLLAAAPDPENPGTTHCLVREPSRVSRIAYVNDRYLRQRKASANIDDRSHQFADGI